LPYDRIKFILGDFYAKVGIENIFKPTIGNERLHQDTNDKGVGMVNLATKKFCLFRARCSCTESFISKPGLLLTGRLKNRLVTNNR